MIYLVGQQEAKKPALSPQRALMGLPGLRHQHQRVTGFPCSGHTGARFLKGGGSQSSICATQGGSLRQGRGGGGHIQGPYQLSSSWSAAFFLA